MRRIGRNELIVSCTTASGDTPNEKIQIPSNIPLMLPDPSEPELVKKRMTACPMRMREVAMMDASGVPRRAVRRPPTRGVHVLLRL